MTAVPPLSAASSELDLVGQRLLSDNPFLISRSNGPSPRDVDVPAIHQEAFTRLTQLARQATAGRTGIGALVWGQAGIGKSHLLARLASWAAQAPATYVYLHNLQAAPAQMPRALLGRVVTALAGGRHRPGVLTPLFELVRDTVVGAVGPNVARCTWPLVVQRYAAFLDRLEEQDLPRAASVDRTIDDVLFRYFRSSYRAFRGREDGKEAELAVRWLSGGALEPPEGRRLGLPPARQADEPLALEGAQEIKQVMAALTRLAAAQKRPFVLVFDQVDNLEEDQAAALARFLQALLDTCAGLLVVTTGVHSTLLRWREKGVIQESAWDRLAQHELLLLRVNAAEALQIVQKRLDHWWDSLPASAAVGLRRQQDPLFPLGQAWFQEALAERTDIRPRDVINRAQEAWRRQQEELAHVGAPAWLERWQLPREATPPQQQTGEQPQQAIDNLVRDKLSEVAGQLLQQSQMLPLDGDHLAELLYVLLGQLRRVDPSCALIDVARVPPPRAGARPAYDLSLRLRGPAAGQTSTTGALVLVATNPASATGFLRRLCDDPRPLNRLLVVTDARLGLNLGVKGKEYLSKLQQSDHPRFAQHEVSKQEHAELETLRRVVALARSGDLEVAIAGSPTRPVSEEEAMASLYRLGRYQAAPLLRELLRLEAAGPVS
jgi:hypothetical protein